jgi:hypothetical protein
MQNRTNPPADEEGTPDEAMPPVDEVTGIPTGASPSGELRAPDQHPAPVDGEPTSGE